MVHRLHAAAVLSNSLWDGRTFRLLNIVDEYNRGILTMEADLSIPALRLNRVLEYLKEFRELLEMIRVDNGPDSSPISLSAGAKKTGFAWCSSNLVNPCRTLM